MKPTLFEVERVPGGIKIKADADARKFLAEVKAEREDWGTDTCLHDVFEGLIGNTEWEWVQPEYVGDLTDAPMIGIYGETRAVDPSDVPESDVGMGRCVGFWDDKARYEPVIERYAYMDYQIRNPLDELLDTGEIFMQGGALDHPR